MKKIYIPNLEICGNYIEEIGTDKDKTLYPGGTFSLNLEKEDFEDSEEYHTVWIALTKAAQKKLQNGTSEQA
jgi:hypothetical protein